MGGGVGEGAVGWGGDLRRDDSKVVTVRLWTKVVTISCSR